MKTVRTTIGLLFLGLIFLAGASTGYIYQNHSGEKHVGTPRCELPPAGSVIRVEAAFPDGTFVGTFAGVRSYYQTPKIRDGKITIILEPNKAYEVTEQKIQNGGHQIILAMIQ